MNRVHGLHHVTAICGDPQENLDFYVGLLGMRLVKRTVNQDATDTYHLFYADGEGSPGTDLTFFPWPHMPPARMGVGLAVEVGMAVPEGSLGFWAERLAAAEVKLSEKKRRFGETVLELRDPHGLALALTESSAPREFVPWREGPVAERHQLRGFHAVRLWERELGTSVSFLTERLGFSPVGEEGGWQRLAVDGGGSGRLVELRELPDERRGALGTGAVHHVAFRVKDEQEQLAVRGQMIAAGMQATPVIDRFWFRSVYCREPGGVLFELATDGPGFARDEPMGQLGERLILPPWLEERRQEIEAGLPALEVPRFTGASGAAS